MVWWWWDCLDTIRRQIDSLRYRTIARGDRVILRLLEMYAELGGEVGRLEEGVTTQLGEITREVRLCLVIFTVLKQYQHRGHIVSRA